MTPVVLDILIIAVLAVFAYLGWQKGLILSLCGLLAFFVAFAGASFVSRTFSGQIAEIVQPVIQNKVEDLLKEHISTSYTSPSTIPVLPGASAVAQEDPVDLVSLSEALNIFTQSALFTGLHDTVTEAVHDGAIEVATTAAAAIAGYIALQLTQTSLFFLSFLIILVVWWLFSRALDLAFQLPILRNVNGIGGTILGIIKGALVLAVVVGFLTVMNIVSMETVQQTHLFQLLNNFHLL